METKELVDLLYDRSYQLIARRPRSRKEMVDYLRRKIIRFKRLFNAEEVIDLVVARLEEEKLIDDHEFVNWWVEQRTYFRPKGERALKQELFKKGVDKQLIDNYLADFPVDEEKLAWQVLQKRAPRLLLLPREKRFEVSMRFLLSRGFSYPVAKKTFALLEKRE